MVGEALGEQVAGGGVAHAPGDEGVDARRWIVVGRHPPAAGTARDDERAPRHGRRAHHTARRSTSARRASPLRIATCGGVLGAHPAVLEQRVDRRVARPGPRRARAARHRCGRGTRGSGRRRARRSGRAGSGRSRAARRPGAGRRRSCRCRARPARRCSCARSLRTISSCSGWIVETMSRIGPERGRSISAARMALWSAASPPGEALVLVGREPAAVDAEPAAQLDAHRLGRGGAVERGGDGGPPVDDDRVAAVVGDVPAPDVEGLVAVVGAGVDPAEEQGRARVVLQRGDAAGEHVAEQLAGVRVAGLGGVEPVGGLAHPAQLVAGVVEVGLLAGEHVGGGGGGAGWGRRTARARRIRLS